jgi:hypothetical protein
MKITKDVLSHVHKDSHEEFKKRCTASQDLFDTLAKHFNKTLRTHQSEARKANNYDKPSWECFQADSIGYQRALDEVIELLKLNKE